MMHLLRVSVLAFLLGNPVVAAGAEWAPIDKSDAKIVFRGPGLGASQIFERSIPQYHQEYGIWSSDTRCPRAEVFLYQLWPAYVFSRSQDLRTIAEMWKFLEGKNPKFSTKRATLNALGRVKYELFSMSTLHCVAFMQHFGTGSGAPNDLGIPPNIIGGYYCDSEPLSGNTVEAVIQGIRVKGYKSKYQAPSSAVCKTDSGVQVDQGTRTPQGAISEDIFKEIDATRKRATHKGMK